MKCITFGWVVVFILLLIPLVMLPISMLLPTSVAGGVYSLMFVGVIIYWLSGFVSDCPDGYFFSNLTK